MSLNFFNIAVDLESELNTFWSGDENTPIFYENTTINTTEDTYLVVNTEFTDTVKRDISSGCTAEVIGLFVVQVVGLSQTGRRDCYLFADKINDHFSDKQIGIVNTDAGRIVNTTQDTDNKYRLSVIIPFSVYQTT